MEGVSAAGIGRAKHNAAPDVHRIVFTEALTRMVQACYDSLRGARLYGERVLMDLKLVAVGGLQLQQELLQLAVIILFLSLRLGFPQARDGEFDHVSTSPDVGR